MRYVNPHTGQPTMFPQQQMQQPQQINPAALFHMVQQNPALQQQLMQMMTQQQNQPQGYPQPVQQQQFPQQFTQQFQQPQQFPQQFVPQQPMQSPNSPRQFVQHGQNQSIVAPSRFSSTESADASVQDAGRFSQAKEDKQESNKPALFSVKPVVAKFVGNDKLKLNVVTSAINKDTNIMYHDDYIGSDCFEEIVEYAVELSVENATKPDIVAKRFVVNNMFYRTEMLETIKALTAKDIKVFYKLFKQCYSESNDKHSINVLNFLDNSLTEAINDFLNINATNDISIENFLVDFNDLLKVIRNNEENLEDLLVSYLDDYIFKLHTNIESLELAKEVTCIPESSVMVYVDLHVYELGITALTNRYVQLSDTASNAFLNSLALDVEKNMDRQEFMLVTLNKNIFKFAINRDKNVFVKKIA